MRKLSAWLGRGLRPDRDPEADLMPLAAAGRQSLAWRQPAWGRRAYRLYAGASPVAVMAWAGNLSGRATARTAAAGWMLDRQGLLGRAVVYEAASGAEVAHYEPGPTDGGELHLAGGRAWRWQRTGILGEAWELADAAGRPGLTLRPAWHWLKHEAAVTVHGAAEPAPELPLLLVTCWYLACTQRHDTTTATVIAGTAYSG